MTEIVQAGTVTFGKDTPVIIAGLCIIENREHTLQTASALKDMTGRHGFPLIFKASFDKANRSSVESYRGPGLEQGLEILRRVREQTGLPVLTDVHECIQMKAVAESVDMIQIPAFLCRQTDLLIAAGQTGKPINLKKGQFMAPWDMGNALEKIQQTGNRQVVLTERGSSFGYNNLVADLRSLSFMRDTGAPVVMDVTHSLQLPGGQGKATGGNRELVPNMARAALAWGCDGLFFEVHEEPERALSDGSNSLSLEGFEALLQQLRVLWDALKKCPGCHL
jgi:2-dehydro-3-deoxyphosphooctonate aldolase (KDO 8-P synthase)